MRLLKFLFTITSIFVAASSVFSSSNEENTSTATTFEIIENYRERKNIMFSAMFGGSSHIVWVLEILEQLSSRGHSTFYVTRVIIYYIGALALCLFKQKLPLSLT